MHHPPAYDVSPDRTEASGEEKKEVDDEPKDRDELFTRMMEAKKSENVTFVVDWVTLGGG